jgi:ferritin-like protein
MLYRMNEEYGIPEEKLLNMVKGNRHNHITTMYYLMLQKYMQGRGSSDSEGYGSDSFDTDVVLESDKEEILAEQSLYTLDSD